MLGRFPLPIGVNAFGFAATRMRVDAVCDGADVRLCLKGDRKALVTEGGHLILVAFMDAMHDVGALDEALLRIPGAVEHEIFIDLYKAGYLATPNGVAVLTGSA